MWTTLDELKFREALSPSAVARLAPLGHAALRLAVQRQPYAGPERRSPYSRAARTASRIASAHILTDKTLG